MPEPAAGLRGSLRWLLAPATEEVPRPHALAAAGLRVLVGLMWLYNVAWKLPPGFGQDSDSGLWKFTSYAVSHPVLPPYSWVVEHLVLPVFEPFGWMVLVLETALAVLLLTGSYVRVAALLGVVQSTAIALSVAFAPHEWPWSYWLMIGAHALLLFSSAGRHLAVDAVRAGLGTGARLCQLWGGLAVAVGAYSALLSLEDPLTGLGPGLRSTDLSLSLGRYNLLGGLLVLLLGLALLYAARRGSSAVGRGVAAIAVLAALSIDLQLAFTDSILGARPTSAAFLLCLAVVALAATGRAGSPPSAPAGEPHH